MLIIGCDIGFYPFERKASNGLEPIGRRSRRCQWVRERMSPTPLPPLPVGSLNEVGAWRDGRLARSAPRVEQQIGKLAFSCSTQSCSRASSRGLGFVEEREQVTEGGTFGSNGFCDLGEKEFERLARGLDLRSLLHQIGSDSRARDIGLCRGVGQCQVGASASRVLRTSRSSRALLGGCPIDIAQEAFERRLVVRNKLADQIFCSLEIPTADDNLVANQRTVKAVVLVLL